MDSHFYNFIQNNKLFYQTITRLSALLVQDGHSVRDFTPNLIREKFWVVHAKSLTTEVLFDLYYCKTEVLPKSSLMSELPTERLHVVDQPYAHTRAKKKNTLVSGNASHEKNLRPGGCKFCFYQFN